MITYKLSRFMNEESVLIEDGEFTQLGLSNTQTSNKSLTFLEDAKYINEINLNDNISCIVCSKEFVANLNRNHIKGIIISPNPRLLYFTIHNKLAKIKDYLLPDFDTEIGKDCKISNLAYIDNKNVKVGNNVTIEEFVSIRGHCRIEDNVIIHSGAQIGTSGYEFKKKGDDFYMVDHCGTVEIHKNVVIWPNTTIHKAVYPWDKTIIGAKSKINSQVHIDHGTKIGIRCEICAGAVISGRVTLKDYAFVGPGAVISNRINIGENSQVSIGSVVTKDVGDNVRVTGNFAIEHRKFVDNLKNIIK